MDKCIESTRTIHSWKNNFLLIQKVIIVTWPRLFQADKLKIWQIKFSWLVLTADIVLVKHAENSRQSLIFSVPRWNTMRIFLSWLELHYTINAAFLILLLLFFRIHQFCNRARVQHCFFYLVNPIYFRDIPLTNLPTNICRHLCRLVMVRILIRIVGMTYFWIYAMKWINNRNYMAEFLLTEKQAMAMTKTTTLREWTQKYKWLTGLKLKNKKTTMRSE